MVNLLRSSLALKTLSKHFGGLSPLPLRDGLDVLVCHEAYKGSVPGDLIWSVVDPVKEGSLLSACTLRHYLCALASNILLGSGEVSTM